MKTTVKGVYHYSYVHYFKANPNYYDINSYESNELVSLIIAI